MAGRQVLLLAFLLSPASLVSGLAQPAKPITILTNALNTARSQNKFAFLEYGLDSCSHCQDLYSYITNGLLTLPAERFVIGKISADDPVNGPLFLATFKPALLSYPIVVITTPTGLPLVLRSGAGTAEQFQNLIVDALRLADAPFLITQPASQSVSNGQSVTFSATVGGMQPLFMQWQFNQADLAGATNTTLTLSAVTTNQAGVYRLVATNLAGSTISQDATLKVVTPPAPGEFLWSFDTGAEVTGSPAIGPDGAIYIGAGNNNLYALRPDGSKKWEYAAGDRIIGDPAIGPDGTIYFGAFDQLLYAVNPDGSEKWVAATTGSIEVSPAVTRSGAIYIGSDSGYLFAFDAGGANTWSTRTTGLLQSSPSVGPEGTIYCGATDKRFYTFTPKGAKSWVFSVQASIFSSPAISTDGNIYFGANDRNLYALSSAGDTLWSFATGGEIYSSPVIGPDGVIYFGSNDGHFYALNPDGTPKWDFLVGQPIQSSAAIGSDGTIYFGAHDAKFYALRADGASRWEYDAADIIVSSPALATNGVIYFATTTGKLHALQASGTLASGNWPMHRRDLRHTASQMPDAPPAPPRLATPNRLAGGRLEIVVTQAASGAWQLEASTNLLQWTKVADLTATNETASWIEENPRALPRRFFRVATP